MPTPITSSNRTASDAPGLLRPACALAAVTLAGFGFTYSLATTALGGALFPIQAQGSLIERDGHVIGSSLVAQPFADPRYFIPRPSAVDYDVMALGGSNQARTNPALRATIATDTATVAAREDISADAVPAELVTRSGSGIDPHIGPDAARVQVARVARTRGLDVATVQRLVDLHTAGPQFGLLGAARVDVLTLNLALDAQTGGRGAE